MLPFPSQLPPPTLCHPSSSSSPKTKNHNSSHLRRERSNSLIKLIINLLNNNRSSTLVGSSELRRKSSTKVISTLLGVHEVHLDNWISGEAKQRGHELWLVCDEVVEERVDVWLQVQDGGCDVEGLGVGEGC